ncbi:unnamed protein product [Didymodactylos carnosus]|uniref:Uncharacterized protein n=1 Tax=Didymodactylos carnosus TaxID=1234261 RepID=A0A814H7V5_9BILA|nr:unnamed protein product [Didymodactylos carnosus]CAF3777222.1 unnamed protein product [Didymodactylos carnosus]
MWQYDGCTYTESLMSVTDIGPHRNIFAIVEHDDFDSFKNVMMNNYQQAVKMRNDRQQTVLHIIVLRSYAYVWIRLLLMRECDVSAQDVDGYTVLHYACERDDVEMLKALTVKPHPTVQHLNNEQLEKIAKNCQKAFRTSNKYGITPFMLACFKGAKKCIQYFHEQHQEICYEQVNQQVSFSSI